MFKNNSTLKFPILLFLIILLLIGAVIVFAAPPGSPYRPGETLSPTCAPGSTNCTVQTPASRDGTINAAEFGLSSANTAAQNNIAWAAILAAIPPKGGIVNIPVDDTAYDFSATITLTKPTYLRGAIGGINNAVGDRQTPLLRWTGGASPAIVASGNGAANSILEGFGLNNSGTGTIGIEIDGPSTGVTIRRVGIVAPTTPFSVAGIRIGATAGVINPQLEDVVLRASAPVGLQLLEIDAFATILRSRFVTHSSQGVLLGTKTKTARAVNFIGSTFEQSNNLDAVFVQRARLVTFDHSYFENGGAGYAIHIPSTATLAENVVVENSWFTINTSGYAINMNFASGELIANNNLYGGTGTAFIFNQARRNLLAIGNLSRGLDIPVIDSETGATLFGNQDAVAKRAQVVSSILKQAQGASVASAAGAITLGEDGNLFKITGTAAITDITIKRAGTQVTLIFTSMASLTDGGNLKLVGNFTGGTDRTITLVSDGTNWFEVARSVN